VVIETATAFTKQEETVIPNKLKGAAQQRAVFFVVCRTTVDSLAGAAGISKSAFYKFYASKELLFFDVLEGCTPKSTRLPHRCWQKTRCFLRRSEPPNRCGLPAGSWSTPT